MEDGLENKIKEIGSMFGITEIPDSITDLIGSFMNNTPDVTEICPNYEQEQQEQPAVNAPEAAAEENDAMKMMHLIHKYQNAKASMEQDNNLRLLRALSPYMSKKRKRKLKNCETMLTILKLL